MVTENLVQESVQPPQDNNHDEDVVVSVEGVSKKFCRDLKKSLWYGLRDMAGEVIGGSQEGEDLRPGEFWALQDISFQLRRGEALGLVGKNGSGKTTLLRILAGLIKPDEGEVKVRGSVAPLIALGAGFNPVLTGKENIYANMSILGLSKQEIDERFDEVVEFAEIPHAIHAPVRSYSSGMKARLGFACAIHTNPDILLIDEVLAVGDVHFRVKCVRKLYELREKGVSFLMVSHNHDALTTTCNSGIYLVNGISVISGSIQFVMDKYESDLFLGSKKSSGILSISPQDSIGKGIAIESITLKNHYDKISGSLITGKAAKLVISLDIKDYFKAIYINIQVDSRDIGRVIYLNSKEHQFLPDFKPGKQTIQINFPYLVLGVGTYSMRVLIRKENGDYLDRVDSFNFTVEKQKGISYSKIYQPHTYQINQK